MIDSCMVWFAWEMSDLCILWVYCTHGSVLGTGFQKSVGGPVTPGSCDTSERVENSLSERHYAV